MRLTRTALPGALTALLSACGGGSGQPHEAQYAFVTPQLNSQRTYSQTVIDNHNNTIQLSYQEKVTAVNADGSYTVLQQDPSNNIVIVDGTNWSIQTQTISLNSSGQESSYFYLDTSTNTTVTCTYDPHNLGPDFPLTLGTTWALDFTLSCANGAPVSYIQDGAVVNVESVTVPAGSFSAIKLQSTVTFTDAQGTTRTQTITNWRDTITLVSVKQSITIAYSGTLPTSGYAVSREVVLTGTT